MSKIRIVYGSETGNTESIAEMIKDELVAKGHDVDCQSAADVEADGLANGYDCVLMGVSIWGIDTIELQSDFEKYDGNFDKMGLKGIKVGAFASGDTAYELYCGGVDYIEEKAGEAGATIMVTGLKVEGDASDNADEVKSFAQSVDGAL